MKNSVDSYLFDWEDCVECSFELTAYQDCTLREPIGNFKRGDKIDYICINFEEGTMEFYKTEPDTQDLIGSFNIRLNVIS